MSSWLCPWCQQDRGVLSPANREKLEHGDPVICRSCGDCSVFLKDEGRFRKLSAKDIGRYSDAWVRTLVRTSYQIRFERGMPPAQIILR